MKKRKKKCTKIDCPKRGGVTMFPVIMDKPNEKDTRREVPGYTWNSKGVAPTK